MTPVANSAKPITDRKKNRSRESMTPFWKPSKCVTTENAATVSTNAGLAQRTSRSVTGLKPARIRNRQITTDRMKRDHLVARHRRGQAGDREVGAGEEQAAEVAGDDHAVVRVAEHVDRDHHRER